VDAIVEVGLINALLAAALAVAAAAVTSVCRRPALAHALWLLVLLKLVTPPLLPVAVPRPAAAARDAVAAGAPPPADPPRITEPVFEPADEPVADAPDVAGADEVPPDPAAALATEVAGVRGSVPEPGRPSWQAAVAGLWLAGSCLWWALAGLRLRRFRLLLRCGRLAPAAVQDRAGALAGRLGLAGCPGVWLLEAPVPPLLWSLLGPPRVLLPARLWDSLTDEQQDTLLAHELAHLRRRDHWVRWLELLALGLYWWLPVAWWARRRLQEAEELLCDARVVRALPGAAAAYAEALLKTVAFLSGPRPALPGAASGLGQVGAMKRRLTMIMRGTNTEALPRAGAWALLAVGAAVLALRPGWAESEASAAQAPAAAPARDAAPAARLAPVDPTTSRAPVAANPATARQPAGDRPAVEAGTGRRFGGAAGAKPESVQAAQDEVELLKASVEAKQAELLEARVLLDQARRALERSARLFKTGALGQEELDKARADVDIRQARLRGKEAQLREAQLRLAQAELRLAVRTRVEPPPAAETAPVPAPRFRQRDPDPRAGGLPTAVTRPPFEPVKELVPRQTAEQRLEQLERQKQQLLREVQLLRQQIQPRGGQGRTQGRPGGAGEVPNPRPAQPEVVPPPARR
jgi:beta-lactamase regulating signal transducer with metallopeptidase domain